MRKGSYVNGFVIGLLIGLLVLLVAGPMYGSIFEKAGSDIDSLSSCDAGLLGSLVGEEGKGVCYSDRSCQGIDGVPSGMRMQYIGEGWGCSKKETPYCCISVPSSSTPISVVHQVAQQNCENQAAGTITRLLSDGAACQTPGRAALSPDGEIVVRYVPKENEQVIEATVTIRHKEGTVEKKIPFSDAQSVSLPSAYALLDEKVVGRSVLNDGGKYIVKIGAGTAEFDVAVLYKYCPVQESAPCSNRKVGRISGGHCVYNQASQCTLTDISQAECTVVYKGSSPLASSPCKGVKPTGVICYVEADRGGVDFGEDFTLCETKSINTCEELEGSSEGRFGGDTYDIDSIKNLFPECSS